MLQKIRDKRIFRTGGLLLFIPIFLSLSVVLSLDSSYSNTVHGETVDNTIRVLEVRYFPKGEQDLVYHPDYLSPRIRTLMTESSKFHGYKDANAVPAINIEVVGVYNRQGSRPNPTNYWYTTYEDVLEQDDLCTVMKQLDVDQLWMWVDPRTGYDEGPGLEYVISSPKFTSSAHGTVATPPFCNGEHSFTFMSFDFSRSPELALHSFGHYMEGLVSSLQTEQFFWYKFSGDDARGYPRSERCGNVHYPPNGASDYDYGNSTVVSTYCEVWNPQGTGTRTNISCSRWGCSHEGYLKWWLQNLPNANNSYLEEGQKIPNWWEFTYDMDENIDKYALDENYFMNRDYLGIYACNLTVKTANGVNTVTSNIAGCGVEDNFMAFTASYRAVNSWQSQQLSTVSLNGSPLTFGCRANSNEYATEVWYMKSPEVGNGGDVTASWNFGNPQDIVIGAKTFKNIDELNPISDIECNTDGGLWQSNPEIGKNPEVVLDSDSNFLAFGTATTYTGGGNILLPDSGKETWYKETANVVSTSISDSGSLSKTLGWTASVNWHWSTGGISLKPFGILPNTPPVINEILDQVIDAGSLFQLKANAVDADPGDILSYSLEIKPSGMTINSQTGDISWQTSSTSAGDHQITVKVEDSHGATATKSFNLRVNASYINFNDFTISSYTGGKQDKVGSVVRGDNGYSMTLVGNTWKAINLPYKVTAKTVIEFDFSSSVKGDIHGLGFDSDLNETANRVFKLYGTENYGINKYNNYTATSGTKHYVINVGESYTGQMSYLTFIMDHDVRTPNAVSKFSNIKIYEKP